MCIIYNYDSRSKTSTHTCKHWWLNHRPCTVYSLQYAMHCAHLRMNNNQNIFSNLDGGFQLHRNVTVHGKYSGHGLCCVVCCFLLRCSRLFFLLCFFFSSIALGFCIFKLIINKYVHFMQICVHIIALGPFLWHGF